MLENADPIEIAWQKAQRYALEHYTQDQLANIASAKSAENVLQHLQLLQSTTNKKRIVRFYGRFRAFLECIAEYEKVLIAYSNSHMALAILWGSVNLLLVVSLSIPVVAALGDSSSIADYCLLGLTSSPEPHRYAR